VHITMVLGNTQPHTHTLTLTHTHRERNVNEPRNLERKRS